MIDLNKKQSEFRSQLEYVARSLNFWNGELTASGIPLLQAPEFQHIIKYVIRLATEVRPLYPTCNFISEKAQAALQLTKWQSPSKFQEICARTRGPEGKYPLFAHEHVVPVAVIQKIIVNPKSQGRVFTQLEGELFYTDILTRFGKRAIILTSENTLLLTHTMPKGFDDPNNKEIFGNIKARYDDAGITLKPFEYKSYSDYFKLA